MRVIWDVEIRAMFYGMVMEFGTSRSGNHTHQVANENKQTNKQIFTETKIIDSFFLTYSGLAITDSGHIQGQGVLWVYGDSLNRYFFESISARRLCRQIFRTCYLTMTWVYILRSTAQVEMDLRYGHNNINIPRILNELKSVIQRPEMQDENSALLLNTGVHLLKSSSFYTYQKVINGMIAVLKRFYRGTVIWKTTTSIGEQKQLYSGCFRRFHTEQVFE